ncbi:hypothetical protein CCP2SC5_400016 [Azospirillaceae bacterium]
MIGASMGKAAAAFQISVGFSAGQGIAGRKEEKDVCSVSMTT